MAKVQGRGKCVKTDGVPYKKDVWKMIEDDVSFHLGMIFSFWSQDFSRH